MNRNRMVCRTLALVLCLTLALGLISGMALQEDEAYVPESTLPSETALPEGVELPEETALPEPVSASGLPEEESTPESADPPEPAAEQSYACQSDDGVAVSAIAAADSGIPADAALHADKLAEGTEAYAQAYDALWQALGLAEGDQLYYLPYDVYFTDAEGGRLEPVSGLVTVTMQFASDPFAAMRGEAGDAPAAISADAGLEGPSLEEPEADISEPETDISDAAEPVMVEERFVAHILADGTVEQLAPETADDGTVTFSVGSFSTMGPAKILSEAGPETVINVPTEAGTIADALARLAGGDGVICLTQDVTVDTTVAVTGGNVTIRSQEGSAFTIRTSGSSENMFALTGGAALTLENVKVDASANTLGRTVTASEDATLTLDEGAELTGNTAFGAVYLDGAAIEISGGTITGNSAGKNEATLLQKTYGTAARFIYNAENAGNQSLGGAVLMVNGSTLTMTAGEISSNSAVCGGGVYAFDSAVSINGGALSYNIADTDTADQAYGGALHVDGPTSTVQIGGSAQITGNTAQRGGAIGFGIDADAVALNITGGSFTGNTAKTYGSIAFISSMNTSIDISGAEFRENSAAKEGGIYKAANTSMTPSGSGKITIHGGAQFIDNTALKGPCLYVTKDNAGAIKEFLVEDATFKGNSATNNAGVIQYNVPNSTFKVTKSTFENNRTDSSGGCFYVAIDAKGTTFTLENSVFTNNYAKQQGGVWRGFPPNADITIKGCTFTDNKAELGAGGCFYFPGDGTNSNITINGGSFTGNFSGSSGGAFRANLDGGAVTVTGGAMFYGNSADVNAGAFSVRRRGGDYYGTVYLLSCTVEGNWCNANFSRYTEADRDPTMHYNTGGVYIGENITCYMYDALVSGNSVNGGYTGGTVGNGIGLCPNAQVFLYPEHGATIYGNGNNGGMDILAVPADPVITYETPAKLYVSPIAPDGRAYNWTDLSGGTARTGEYDWTNIRSGVAPAALGPAGGETNLNPVGFKSHISDAGIATIAAGGSGGYAVQIIDNFTKSALYGGGGMMVNGTVISGELNVSVQKKTVGLPADKANAEFGFTFTVGGYGSSGTGTISVPYTKYVRTGGSTNGSAEFTYHESITSSDGGPSAGMQYSFTLQSDEKITFDFKDSGFSFSKGTNYQFWLEETDPQDASSSRITYIAYAKDGSILSGDMSVSGGPTTEIDHIDFTCTNIFEENNTELDLTKKVDRSPSYSGLLWDFDIQLTNSGAPVTGTYHAEVHENEDKDNIIDCTDNDLQLDGDPEGGGGTGGGWTITFDDTGKGHVKLKKDQTLHIYGLPVGTEYTITETNANTNGYTTENPKITGGPLEAGTPKEETITNEAPETLPLKFSKTTNYDVEQDRLWHFEVTLTPPEDAKYSLEGVYRCEIRFDDKPGDAKTCYVRVDKDGDVRIEDPGDLGKDLHNLKEGDYIALRKRDYFYIYGLPKGIHYVIREVEANTGGYNTTTEPTSAVAGTVEGDLNESATVTYTNTKLDHGDLTVSKTVAGEGGDTTRSWHFKITLKNDNADMHLAGDYRYSIKTGGTAGPSDWLTE